MKILSLLGISLVSFSLYAQRGKNGDYNAAALNTIVNAYTSLTANATAGQASLTVASTSLTSPVLTTPLAPGDLLLIIQMQGASMNIEPLPAIPVSQGGWGSEYTTVLGQVEWYNYLDVWGDVVNYNQAGKYEYVQVASVPSANTINLSCGLVNSYVIAGKVQVVRVPRFSNLTVSSGASIVPTAWDGTSGGVLALEVDGDLTISASAKIDASGKGFRGGRQTDNVSTSAGSGSVNDIPYCATYLSQLASEKGEGIGGFTAEYDALYSRYGVSAPANGGGGAHHHNAGGGGGSNVGTGAYTGKGVPDPAYNAMWNLETPPIGGVNSSGGGRGGYSYSTSNQNEASVGPNQLSWSGDYRRNNGGRGGHPLTADPTRVFMGGGGGAGDRDNNTASLNQDGAGGAGGGIVLVQCFGNITGGAGNSFIDASGGNGISVNSANATAIAANKLGNDGAGGGGGGGAIIISSGSAVANTVTLNTRGGNGGNQNLSLGPFATVNEADGPGGGGAGGHVSVTSSAAPTIVSGGSNGVTNSSHVSAFPPNGATSGGDGISGTGVNFYDLTAENDTICGSASTTLNVNLIGTLPAGAVVFWYTDPFSGPSFATGLSYTTPVLTTTTTYYVGACPGDFRIPVQVVVGPEPVISGTAVVADVTCAGNDGSVTGLTVSSGTPAYTYSWNSTTTSSADLAGAIAGNYTLTVTDDIGCTATSGPYTINSAGGPVIDATNIVITNETCAGADGSITGITHTGGVVFSWSDGVGNAMDATGLSAGTYTLTVTDASNCVATSGPYTITAPAGPSINLTNMVLVSETCTNSNGSISGITATGTGLTYSWNNTSQATLDINNLDGGIYVLTVTDDQGCSISSSNITLNEIVQATIDVAGIQITPETCGLNNGEITGIVVSGGTPILTFAWSNTSITSLSATNLDAGSYTLTVTDGDGCVVTSGPHVVNDTPGPVINDANVVVENESCTGGDGSIAGITATGTGLTYSWNNTNGTLDLTNAIAGTYTLEVTDANNCTATSGPYVINGSVPMSIDVTNIVVIPSDCDENTGSISGITLTGVNPVFTWSNSATTLTQTNLAPGTYTINAVDDQGCTDTEIVTIPSGSGPIINVSNVQVTHTTCGANNGSIQGLVGPPSTTYSWGGVNQLTIDLNNLSAGSYTMTATGANGCTSQTGPFIINGSSAPTADFSYSPADVSSGVPVQFTDLSSNDVVSWAWTIGAETFTIENPSTILVGPASYQATLVVTNAAGCTATAVKIINVFDEIIVPNVLTTNQDGLNDKFEIKGLKDNTELEIVNRWGNVVFKTGNYQNDWAGQDFNGEKLSNGVYTYYIKTAKGQYKQGFVHLID